jgi:hypothetical protein
MEYGVTTVLSGEIKHASGIRHVKGSLRLVQSVQSSCANLPASPVMCTNRPLRVAPILTA